MNILRYLMPSLVGLRTMDAKVTLLKTYRPLWYLKCEPRGSFLSLRGQKIICWKLDWGFFLPVMRQYAFLITFFCTAFFLKKSREVIYCFFIFILFFLFLIFIFILFWLATMGHQTPPLPVQPNIYWQIVLVSFKLQCFL